MISTPDRATARLAWTRRALDDAALTLEPASADASFRSYWRTRHQGHGWIVMDSPPAQEDPRPWLEIGARLSAAGLHVPAVRAQELEQGFLLIEDLGSRLYLPALNDRTVDTLYGDAMDALLRMQRDVDVTGMQPYDHAFLQRELEIMPEWFLGRHLGCTPACGEWDVLESAFTVLLKNALEQPRRFVHRDYHSRNLLITAANSPGIIDFQGALVGPVTYDLASLLRDCYIAWDRTRVDAWAEAYRLRLCEAGLVDAAVDRERFLRWFDLTGLQRHIKVLGIFCRLYYRDGKSGYLDDLPRVYGYVLDVAGRYPELADFAALLRRRAGGRDLRLPVAA
ncbi:aminoglycoside phosphotransferase [Rhodanobacter sp. FW510-R12]|uniref:aminoglycoside phosphotransferase family protein n=1 Tax=unclassified Rhodanobacter TaxID=2621553 RepID=UPI0007A9E8DD|nr:MULTISPECIES: phosphotransferase [unclassified Rhodanobacter]KZC16493.1 aminoglycoside phosphotransferase [Rhodanobacter sp. FW104-R8]KZC28861.1 aminoglycoside phosphotransferase [Rhodanobacter sp. FW510-T8]KZC31507.1 aminoglycoside phosphotransferase [Rhodanobacter sp. FW510-R10]